MTLSRQQIFSAIYAHSSGQHICNPCTLGAGHRFQDLPHPASLTGDFPFFRTAPSSQIFRHRWKQCIAGKFSLRGKSWNSIHQQVQSHPHPQHQEAHPLLQPQQAFLAWQTAAIICVWIYRCVLLLDKPTNPFPCRTDRRQDRGTAAEPTSLGTCGVPTTKWGGRVC